MEKYGVAMTQEELMKLASEDGTPVTHAACGGGKVTRHGPVIICENCGTEPFEANDKPISMSSIVKGKK